MKKINLTQGKFTIISDEDFDKISEYKWFYGMCNGIGYACANQFFGNGKYKRLLMHRIIMDAPPDKMTDHINKDPLDNRRSNLRLCTNAQNQFNSKTKLGASGIKGVSWHKIANKWRTQLRIGNKRIHLGLFKNKLDAGKAYQDAVKKYHGEFAGVG